MIIIGCFLFCNIQHLRRLPCIYVLLTTSRGDNEERCSSPQTQFIAKLAKIMKACLIYLTHFFSIHFIFLASQGQILPITSHEGESANHIETYIVFLEKLPGTHLLSDELLENWHRSFLPNTTLDSGEPRLVYSYREVISGFAAKLTSDEVRAMRTMEGFLHAQPDQSHSLRTTHTPEFLGLSEWDGLWPDSYYGQGVVIGIVDTGALPTHISFGDIDMPPPPSKWNGTCDYQPHLCNNKIIGAKTFKGGRIQPSKFDDVGHGTHVASIAAGNFVDGAEVLGQAKGRARGMAPKAHLAIYKAGHKTGPSYQESDVLACVDDAIQDGVDILSFSIGTKPVAMHLHPVLIGAFSAMQQGIFVCASAGNSGPYESTVEDDGPWLTTVGAGSTNRRIRTIVRLGNGTELIGESAYQPLSLNSTTLEVVFPGRKGLNNSNYCTQGSFKNIDVRGKLVLCVFGKITFAEKSENVKREGGAAMIVINYSWYGSTTDTDATVIPAAHLNATGSKIFHSYVISAANYTPTATIIFKGTIFDDYPAPRVASFSARGPSQENGGILKPDIFAPGEGILGASPFIVGPSGSASSDTWFNFMSGTSMATPHIAGIAALLKSNHPRWSPAAIKSAIMPTAQRVYNDQTPIIDESSGEKANYFAMGAGHVNPADATDPGLIYDLHPSDYVPYLCSLGYTDDEVTKFTKNRTYCAKVHFEADAAEQLNYPSIAVSLKAKSMKTINRTVTNVGDATSVYTFDIEEPNGVGIKISPDKLEFTSIGEQLSFNVTFIMKGSIPIKNEASEGKLSLNSGKYYVTSPIVVTFI